MGAQRRQCCATFTIETRTRNAVVERRRWKGEELFGYSKVELLSLLYSPQRYRSMVKTRDVNERRYGDTVSRDSAIAIHILNLSYLTISNLRIGEICADRIFFHLSIHPSALFLIIQTFFVIQTRFSQSFRRPRVGYEFFLDQKYEEKGRGGDALRDKIDGQF